MACRVETRLTPRRATATTGGETRPGDATVWRMIWGANGLAAASGLSCVWRDQRDFVVDLEIGAIRPQPFGRLSA